MTCKYSNVSHFDRLIHGFTLIELLVILAIISLLLAILIPVLHKARTIGNRITCRSNLKQIALAWHMYLDDNNGAFYQGVNVNHDFGGWKGNGGGALHRPLNRCIGLPAEIRTSNDAEVFKCPADVGGQDCGQSAYLYFGNSYQTNLMLIGPDALPAHSFLPEPMRTLNRAINKRLKDLTQNSVSDPSRLLLVGDNNWITQWDPLVHCDEGWHGKHYHFNLSFLDGHAEFIKIHKGLYVTSKYRVQPFKEVDSLAYEIQEEVPCP